MQFGLLGLVLDVYNGTEIERYCIKKGEISMDIHLDGCTIRVRQKRTETPNGFGQCLQLSE